ncbi:MAG: class I SAM-dependent methyltransferase [Spirochaetales bacterium]|nr:class I SAM-dependent methyltransferase [Spirochaetales bacterium]
MSVTNEEMIRILENKGYGIIPPEQFRIDMEDSFKAIWADVGAYTMTSVERGYALYKAVHYIIGNAVGGDFVECGVWKGGSCMLIARTLLELGVTDRSIFLYDTFEGMPEPGGNDYIAWNGRSVHEKWEEDRLGEKNNFTSWAVDLDSVKANIKSTAYPEDKLIFVRGPVEETLRNVRPDKIGLLRLDTDWYESTKAELELLYPRLTCGGVLILDDYGHFTGAKMAVDEYFAGHGSPPLLNRIDYTGRVAVKN